MKNVTLLFILLLPLCAWALAPATEATLYEHLKEVNPRWQYIKPTEAQLRRVSFANDTRRIQAHLFEVEQWLCNSSACTGNAKRNILLNVLHGYAEAAVFPQNYDFDHRIPYFIDAHNTACAVGYLMIADGQQALAEKIRNTNNYQYLLDMQYPELKQWVASSGFTAEELALIQPAYMASTPFSHMAGNSGGTNGHVNKVLVTGPNNTVYIAGSFTTVNGESGFNNIAYFDGSAWHDMDGGLNNAVNAMAVYNGELYVGGDFRGSALSGVASEGIIKWNGTEWEAVDVFGLYGKVNVLKVFNDKLYLGGDFEIATGALRGYLMTLDGNGPMILPEFPMGPVHSLAVYNNQLVVGGDFSQSNILTPLGNVAVLDAQGSFSALGGGIHGKPLALEAYQGKLYMGGPFFDGQDTLMGFGYWNDTVWTDESFHLQSADSTIAVHDLYVHNNQLYVGGKFFCCNSLVMYYGENIAQYSHSNGSSGMQGITTFNNTVHSVAILDGELLVGGQFDTVSFGTGVGGPANYVGNLGGLAIKTDNWQSVLPINGKETRVAVYPNPASGKIYFSMDAEALTLQPSLTILNTLGQTVSTIRPTAARTEIDLSKLQSGVYLYRLTIGQGASTGGRFVVE